MGRAVVNIPSPEQWMAEVERRGNGVRVDKVLGVKESLAELIASGLRREEGISAEEWSSLSEGLIDFDKFCLEVKDTVGLLNFKGRLRVSKDKIAVLDHILPYLLVALDASKLQKKTN